MITVNVTGVNQAKKLIRQGKIDTKSAWKFTASDKDKLLGDNNWAEYKKWFLGIDKEAAEETKKRYKFPFGKNGKVYRSGLMAAKKRAAQYGYKDIENKADALLEMIDNVTNWYKLEAGDNGLVKAFIYGVIGWDLTADEFVKDLAKCKPKKVELRVNSPGGSVFEGLAVYNYLNLADFDVDVYVDGIAASAASVIACAGNVYMPENALFMIHNPSGGVIGEAKDMRKQADVLDKIQDSIVTIYQQKTGLKRDEIVDMVENETWLSASEAKELGFCDTVVEPLQEMAVYDLHEIYNHVPEKYYKRSVQMSKEKEFFASFFEKFGIEAEIDAKEAFNYIKDNFIVEEPKTEPDVPEEVAMKLKEYENKIAALETANLVKQLEDRVGSGIASLLGRAHRDISNEVFDALVSKIEGLKKAVNDLGDSKGSGDVPDETVNNVDDVVNKKTAEIAEELKCSMADALIELAKRDPELIANWR